MGRASVALADLGPNRTIPPMDLTAGDMALVIGSGVRLVHTLTDELRWQYWAVYEGDALPAWEPGLPPVHFTSVLALRAWIRGTGTPNISTAPPLQVVGE